MAAAREEWWNAFTHDCGAVLGAIGAATLITMAALQGALLAHR